MGNLKVHDKLDIQAGGQVEVLDEFGSGGQGTVYKVSYNGKTYDGTHGRNCKCLRYFGTWQTSQKHRSCGASENSR